MIAQRYGLSPFSQEIKEIINDPIKREIMKVLLLRKTDERIGIENQVEMFRTLQKDLLHMVDIALTTYINFRRGKGASPIRSIFESPRKQTTTSGNQTIIIERNF